MLSLYYYWKARQRYKVYSEIVNSLGEDPDARMLANRDLAKMEMVYYSDCGFRLLWKILAVLVIVGAVYTYMKGIVK